MEWLLSPKSLSPKIHPRSAGSHSRNQSLSTVHSYSSFNSSMPKKLKYLSKLKGRNSNPNLNLSPELASQVIKLYFLPMFQDEFRDIQTKLRATTYGVSKSGEIFKNSLSSILKGELELVYHEIQILLSRLDQTNTRKDEAAQELIETQQKLWKAQLELNCMNFQLNAEESNRKQIEIQGLHLNREINEQINSLKEIEGKKCELTRELYKEISFNEMLKQNAIELTHGYAIYKMKNDIMGESLKGLHQSCKSVVFPTDLEEILKNEIKNSSRYTYRISQISDQYTNDLKEVLKENDEHFKYNGINAKKRISLRSELKQLKNSIKTKLDNLNKNLIQAISDRRNFKESLEKLENQYKELTETYERARLDERKLGKKFEVDERICKNCQKPYYESQNFNWSCKRHQSTWSGEVYWCCGKRDINAIGCQSSHHVSREEDEGNSDEPKFKFKRCSSCKEYGHGPHECPKDPNAQTNRNAIAIVERHRHLTRIKKGPSTMNLNQVAKAKMIMSERLQGKGFGNPNVSTLETEETVFGFEKGFNDIKNLKKEVEFQPEKNLFIFTYSLGSKSGKKGKSLNSSRSSTPKNSEFQSFSKSRNVTPKNIEFQALQLSRSRNGTPKNYEIQTNVRYKSESISPKTKTPKSEKFIFRFGG
ncbi:unnamed protein product [Blepharisma stoltei]|uniref:Uncharacterized protein n=1 Tax=Blepharisma stoltei TaxID=1481888 RepID=A0AAU9JR04_9CILI|nr:unnamed protein product [Blepharisma stoltei]